MAIFNPSDAEFRQMQERSVDPQDFRDSYNINKLTTVYSRGKRNAIVKGCELTTVINDNKIKTTISNGILVIDYAAIKFKDDVTLEIPFDGNGDKWYVIAVRYRYTNTYPPNIAKYVIVEKSFYNIEEMPLILGFLHVGESGSVSYAEQLLINGITYHMAAQYLDDKNYVHPLTHPATMIEQDEYHRFVTDQQIQFWDNKADKINATHFSNGLMSASDKYKLDGIPATAQENQNAFSHVRTADSIISAATKTDSIIFKDTSRSRFKVEANEIKLDIINVAAEKHTHLKEEIVNFSHQHTANDVLSVRWNSIIDKPSKVSLHGIVDVYTKEEIDIIKNNFNVLTECYVATTTNITLSGLQTIDGVQLLGNERVLVRQQIFPHHNGIYISAAGAWSRAEDFNTSGKIVQNSYVFVTDGNKYMNSSFVMISKNVNLGTSAINWALFDRNLLPFFSNHFTKDNQMIDLQSRLSAGAYTKVTVNEKGIVVQGNRLEATDLPFHVHPEYLTPDQTHTHGNLPILDQFSVDNYGVLYFGNESLGSKFNDMIVSQSTGYSSSKIIDLFNNFYLNIKSELDNIRTDILALKQAKIKNDQDHLDFINRFAIIESKLNGINMPEKEGFDRKEFFFTEPNKDKYILAEPVESGAPLIVTLNGVGADYILQNNRVIQLNMAPNEIEGGWILIVYYNGTTVSGAGGYDKVDKIKTVAGQLRYELAELADPKTPPLVLLNGIATPYTLVDNRTITLDMSTDNIEDDWDLKVYYDSTAKANDDNSGYNMVDEFISAAGVLEYTLRKDIDLDQAVLFTINGIDTDFEIINNKTIRISEYEAAEIEDGWKICVIYNSVKE